MNLINRLITWQNMTFQIRRLGVVKKQDSLESTMNKGITKIVLYTVLGSKLKLSFHPF